MRLGWGGLVCHLMEVKETIGKRRSACSPPTCYPQSLSDGNAWIASIHGAFEPMSDKRQENIIPPFSMYCPRPVVPNEVRIKSAGSQVISEDPQVYPTYLL